MISFAWRSDTSTGLAFRNLSDGRMSARRLSVDAVHQSGTSSAIGTDNFHLPSTKGQLEFTGKENFDYSKPMSALCRWAPDYDGTPSLNHHIFGCGGSEHYRSPGILLVHRTTGDIELWVYDSAGTNRSATTVASLSATSGKFVDLFFTFRADTHPSIFNFYIDNVLQTSPSLSMLNTYADVRSNSTITLGYNIIYARSLGYHNELVLWDTIEDPNSINTVTPGGVTTTGDQLDGSTRAGWVDAVKRDGLQWDSLTAGQIQSGVEQIQGGLTQTGSLLSETWQTLSASNIKSGVSQIQNSSTITGTYLWSSLAASSIVLGTNQIQDSVTITGSLSPTTETWTSLTADKILNGITQIQNSITITGTIVAPAPSSGTAGALDIPNIKEQVRWILDTNNTTTSSVLDLSASMSKRVRQIQKVNPEKLSLQANLFPAVTVFAEKKSIVARTIARNQITGKREAKLSLSIVGMVWNQNFSADINNDPADQDLEYLMENIERVLRSYPDLGNNVTWQIPNDITYHNASFDEKAHFRVGFLDIEVTVFY